LVAVAQVVQMVHLQFFQQLHLLAEVELELDTGQQVFQVDQEEELLEDIQTVFFVMEEQEIHLPLVLHREIQVVGARSGPWMVDLVVQLLLEEEVVLVRLEQELLLKSKWW
jgi:hypothetical protein